MSEPDLTAIAVRFNESINSRDVGGLAELMSDDHRFVDSEANAVSGKQACLDAWRGFFDLAGPALWTATIRGETVTEWRVHDDTPENRARLGVS